MTGNITRRGKNSWRLKFDTGERGSAGKRLTRYVTVRGTKKQAQAELTRLLAANTLAPSLNRQRRQSPIICGPGSTPLQH